MNDRKYGFIRATFWGLAGINQRTVGFCGVHVSGCVRSVIRSVRARAVQLLARPWPALFLHTLGPGKEGNNICLHDRLIRGGGTERTCFARRGQVKETMCRLLFEPAPACWLDAILPRNTCKRHHCHAHTWMPCTGADQPEVVRGRPRRSLAASLHLRGAACSVGYAVRCRWREHGWAPTR